MSTPPKSSLSYTGIAETHPPDVFTYARNPTGLDHKQWYVGDIWINVPLGRAYIMTNKTVSSGTWLNVGGGASSTLTGNIGGAVGPDALLNINIVGTATNGINVTGNPATNTLTIGFQSPYLDGPFVFLNTLTGAGLIDSTRTPNAVATYGALGALAEVGPLTNGQLCIGSTGAQPVAANLLSAGSTIAITNGAGSINLETGGAIATSYLTDDANSAIPAAGVLTVAGGSNIATSSAASTVTITLDGTTNHAVQVGNAGGSLTSLGVGATGELLVGATGADPAFATVAYGNFAFSNLTAATPRTLTVSNTDVNAASLATLQISVPPLGADASLTWEVQGTLFYAAGVDNSDSDKWKLTNSSDPSSGNALITTTTAGVITLFNDLDVTEGGTGVSTLTSHGVLMGNGASDIQATAEPSDGQLLIGKTGDFPQLATLASAGGTITITNGAGTINLESVGGGGGGRVLQYLQTSTSSRFDCTTTMPTDDTIPQNTEGDEILTLTITPTSISNYLVIKFNTFGTATVNTVPACGLFQDSTANALAAEVLWSTIVDELWGNGSLFYKMTAGTTSATTFKIRVGPNAGAGNHVYLNGYSAGRVYGGVASTTLEIWEINTSAITGSFFWSVVNADATIVVNRGYIANKAGLLTMTLPATAAIGDTIRLTGINTAVGIRVAQNANQRIHFSLLSTTAGVGGYIESTQIRDSVELVCVVAGASTEYNVISSEGNWTVV